MTSGDQDTRSGNSTDGKGTVIFVGGTAYSGSTLLDMILANDPAGHSCGEVNCAVHPYLPYHVDPECGCGDADCRIWKDIALHPQDTHEHLFRVVDDVGYLVDSSKDIPWIKQNADRLRRTGFDVRHVLIWKTPAEYYRSRKKRGEEQHWAESWLNYHRAYMSLVKPFVAVRYADLVQQPGYLEKLCGDIGLAYFEGKERYWERKQHTLFGNSSAKIHLHSEESAEFHRMSSELDTHASASAERPRHALYYENDEDDLPDDLPDAQRAAFGCIVQTLQAHAPGGAQRDGMAWSLSGTYLQYMRMKSWWRSWRYAHS